MKRLLLAGIAALALITGAQAQSVNGNPSYPPGSLPIAASSGNVAAGTAAATLAARPGYTNYLCGLNITSSGSTGALAVNPTITGLAGGTLTLVYTSVAGAALPNAPLVIPISPCFPATGPNAAVVVTMPTLGAGNTNTAVNAFGYQLQAP